ncbi:hypothetical protein [Arthrobacter livingstonensis]|uniref:hypothetical protein n=1 Tax=Arthrobacter livingstonensis TaxID=670078 RepID=UPI0011B3F4CD|nr:hypothetical protein [Arthrobacter livingstonensis]
MNGTICFDTGCTFGGKLTALRNPEKQVAVSVPVERTSFEPAKPPTPAEPAVRGREPGMLKIDDALGRQLIET